jgi:hypothetical protein
MNEIQILCFIGLIFISTLKAFAFKPCAKYLPSHYTPIFISFWMMLSVLLVSPYFFQSLVSDFNKFSYELAYGILKGVFFFQFINYSQKITKETASSKALMGAVSVGITAIINFSFLNEELTKYQFISALLMMILGFVYYFKGHLSETSRSSKKSVFMYIFLGVLLSIFDHLGLSSMHWYTYLFLNILTFFIISMIYCLKYSKDISIKFFFSNKKLLIAAFVYVIAEFYFTSVRVSVLPVTTSNVAALMAVPVIMVFMSIYWKESTVKKQSFFGIMVFIIGMVSFI